MEVVELAALKEFVARGYDDTTADHIAASAGVSIRTYFRYFPRGKEDVMVLQFRRRDSVFVELVVRRRRALQSGELVSPLSGRQGSGSRSIGG